MYFFIQNNIVTFSDKNTHQLKVFMFFTQSLSKQSNRFIEGHTLQPVTS